MAAMTMPSARTQRPNSISPAATLSLPQKGGPHAAVRAPYAVVNTGWERRALPGSVGRGIAAPCWCPRLTPDQWRQPPTCPCRSDRRTSWPLSRRCPSPNSSPPPGICRAALSGRRTATSTPAPSRGSPLERHLFVTPILDLEHAGHPHARKFGCLNNGNETGFPVLFLARRETRDPKMDRRWPAISEILKPSGGFWRLGASILVFRQDCRALSNSAKRHFAPAPARRSDRGTIRGCSGH